MPISNKERRILRALGAAISGRQYSDDPHARHILPGTTAPSSSEPRASPKPEAVMASRQMARSIGKLGHRRPITPIVNVAGIEQSTSGAQRRQATSSSIRKNRQAAESSS